LRILRCTLHVLRNHVLCYRMGILLLDFPVGVHNARYAMYNNLLWGHVLPNEQGQYASILPRRWHPEEVRAF
jgi:hypothetical protein